jgi:hypothetical protein
VALEDGNRAVARPAPTPCRLGSAVSFWAGYRSPPGARGRWAAFWGRVWDGLGNADRSPGHDHSDMLNIIPLAFDSIPVAPDPSSFLLSALNWGHRGWPRNRSLPNLFLLVALLNVPGTYGQSAQESAANVVKMHEAWGPQRKYAGHFSWDQAIRAVGADYQIETHCDGSTQTGCLLAHYMACDTEGTEQGLGKCYISSTERGVGDRPFDWLFGGNGQPIRWIFCCSPESDFTGTIGELLLGPHHAAGYTRRSCLGIASAQLPLKYMKVYLAGVLFSAAFLIQLKAIAVFRQMMGEVNKTLPADSRIPAFGPSWLRGRVINLHRNFFPASGLRRQLYVLWWIDTAVFISAVACLVRFQ